MTILSDYGVCFAFETHRTNIFARIVRKVTGSDISHNFMTIGELLGQDIVLEADYSGFNVNLLEKYFGEQHSVEVYAIEKYSSEDVKAATQKVMYTNGMDSYGFAQAGGFLLAPMFGNINPLKKGVVCSEATYYILEELDPGLVKNYTPDYFSPHQLREIIRSISKKVAVKRYGNRVMEYVEL